jgi:probable rRNA maturation factor
VIVNQQHRVALRRAPLAAFLSRVQRELEVPAGAVTVAFVTDAAMRKMNHAYRGKDKPTDVLSFPSSNSDEAKRRQAFPPRAPKRGEPAALPSRLLRASQNSLRSCPNTSYLGDIAIAPAVARRNARRCGRALDNELRILILHGVLHLLGYDHETDRGQMDRVEARLRRRLGLEDGVSKRGRKQK